MRILIDECLYWRLSHALTSHYSVSMQKVGWGGIKNGALLELAEKEFDVFLTGDRNLSFQQDVTHYEIAIVVLHAPGTQLRQTLPLIPKVLLALPSLRPGHVLDVRRS
jgi:predicted nuclease of predicted toxin-antitoxin system